MPLSKATYNIKKGIKASSDKRETKKVDTLIMVAQTSLFIIIDGSQLV